MPEVVAGVAGDFEGLGHGGEGVGGVGAAGDALVAGDFGGEECAAGVFLEFPGAFECDGGVVAVLEIALQFGQGVGHDRFVFEDDGRGETAEDAVVFPVVGMLVHFFDAVGEAIFFATNC